MPEARGEEYFPRESIEAKYYNRRVTCNCDGKKKKTGNSS